ncbi:hypothetical protein LWI29_020622 [Acer saccharum]|uniref:Uncharacterized protein n=1 Tax=Acer saccharum TaxID=4024 RepID=A0AA39RIC1_ACESA|nr:hypothetical protein LWI29_020622 [Acer saccharum]
MKNLPRLLMVELLEQYLFSKEGKPPTALEDVLDGPLGLYKGLSPAIIRHLFYTPIRIVGYENLRNLLLPDHAHGGSISLFSKAIIGGFSGVIAQSHR